MYNAGAAWWLTDPELIAQAAHEQEARFQSGAWDELIERWLTTAKQRVNSGYGGYEHFERA
jgi:predicted P-loop ATPase